MSSEARRAVASRASSSHWIRERFGASRFAALGLPGGGPTILIDGEDVSGQRKPDEARCRIYDQPGRAPDAATIAADTGAKPAVI